MKRVIVFILLSLFAFSILGQGHKIDIKILNLKNKEVILGHHFNDQLIPDDTIVLNAAGMGSFSGKEPYPGGMYLLFLPNKSYFDFLLDKDQEFLITADTFDFDQTVSYKGSDENTVFNDYRIMLNTKGRQIEDLMKEREANKGDKAKTDVIDAKIKVLRDEMNSGYQKLLNEKPDLFFTKFLKATRSIDVPTSITDKKQQYFYFRNHYFDNFDVSDPRLLRTPIYEATIDRFLDQVLVQMPDTLIKETDKLIEKSRTNQELFRYMLVHLFNKYASSQMMTHENVYVHIADKYYIKEAVWSDKEFISELKDKVARRKLCLVGNKALNIEYVLVPSDSLKLNDLILKNQKLKTDGLAIDKTTADTTIKYNLKVELLKEYFDLFTEGSSLYTDNSAFTILWFWTPDCSHCKKETPEFYKLYQEKKLKEKNVDVISIYMQKDITDWKKFAENNDDWLKFIKNNNMSDWKNVWNPFDPFRRNYDITSSPVLYLLDKDKKIIAKKIGYAQAIEIIESELARTNP
jgi:thiol-disulfide isomerase/thioredoxin